MNIHLLLARPFLRPLSSPGSSYAYLAATELVFRELNLELPAGPVALVGQNGTGKSTLMLLASGIAEPSAGVVFLHGVDTAELREEELRQRHVSLIHQNMGFETEEGIGRLLHFVVENTFHERRTDRGFCAQLIDELQLEQVLEQHTGEVSKGELQRTLNAFFLLYGSRTLMMDEPVFALEERQKHRTMSYLFDYTTRNGLSWYYSVHELELSAVCSWHCILFDQVGAPEVGATDELHARARIEAPYQVPYDFLKRREAIYRDALIQL